MLYGLYHYITIRIVLVSRDKTSEEVFPAIAPNQRFSGFWPKKRGMIIFMTIPLMVFKF